MLFFSPAIWITNSVFLLFASIHGLNECKRGSICLSRESMTMWLYRSKFNVEAFKCHSPVFRFRFQHFQWVVHAMHCMDWWEIIRQWSQTSISRQLNTSNDNIYIFTSNGFEPISLSLSLTHTSSRLCSWIFIQFWFFSFSQLHSKCSSAVSMFVDFDASQPLLTVSTFQLTQNAIYSLRFYNKNSQFE